MTDVMGCSRIQKHPLAAANMHSTKARQQSKFPRRQAWESFLPKGLVGVLRVDPRLLSSMMVEPAKTWWLVYGMQLKQLARTWGWV